MSEGPGPRLDTLELLAAIHGLQTEVLADDPSSEQIFERLLETLLELTSSEYGFVGERCVDQDGAPYLRIRSLTDISWDEATQRMYAAHPETSLEFRNLDTLFGVTIRGDGPVIANAPAQDERSGGLPEGHPGLDAYLGLPIEWNGELLGMIAIANRPGGYDASMIEALSPFCSTCASVLNAHRAQNEQRVLEHRIEVGERLASLGLLASRVAHDLNNILMGVRGRTHRARKRAGGLIDNELTAIDDAVERMGELTRELLTFAGGREHRSEVLELGQLVDDVHVLLELALPPTSRLVVSRDGDAPVRGDPAPLRQVLMNFVTNAAEAMDGVGDVEIHTGIVDAEAWLRDAFVVGEAPSGPCSLAVVRDRGPGVAAENLSSIFVPFTTTKADGRGLGLAGVPGIVSAHGGCVAVRNELDGGASFALLLPQVAGFTPRPEPQAAAPAAGGRILVVESDDAVRTVTCRVLNERGWQAEGSQDFASALEAIRSGELAALVLDVNAPSPLGEALFWHARGLDEQLPVVLTTGFADVDVESSLRQQEGVEVLAKPFGGAELAAVLGWVARGGDIQTA